MNRLMLFSIFLLLILVNMFCSSFGVTVDDFEQYWHEFRTRFPFHIQIVSLLPEKSGRQALIISEPPPHVSIESFQKFTDINQVTVKEHRMGVDGYVRDLLCVLPKLKDQELDSLLIAIHDFLFFSTYKAEVVEWPLPPKRSAQPSEYDIEISFAELNEWLLEDNPNFFPILGGKRQSIQDLILNSRDGVFISEQIGFVIWIIPRKQDLLLEQFATAARIWTIEADLVIGAIASDDCLAIIGRERSTSVLDLPPLRTEEIMRLASADLDELAQSYERKHIFAGRFNETDDWAPIYLSDILIDTEYGSLLCLTDQLLKSWTQNGTVRYANFQYSKPVTEWAWEQPLSELLGISELTFNWNTQGVGFAVEEPPNTLYGIGRTGALAVSYIPGGEQAFWSDTAPDTNMVKYENLGYEFFAKTGDPNIARVVQYASLFQIFREFDIAATPPNKAVPTMANPYEPIPFNQYRSLVNLMESCLDSIQSLQYSTTKIHNLSLRWVFQTRGENHDTLSTLMQTFINSMIAAKVLSSLSEEENNTLMILMDTFIDSILNERNIDSSSEDKYDTLTSMALIDSFIAEYVIASLSKEEYDTLFAAMQTSIDSAIIEEFIDSLGVLIYVINDIYQRDPINGIRIFAEELVNHRQIGNKDSSFFLRLAAMEDMTGSRFEEALVKPENFDIYVYMIAQNFVNSFYYSEIFKTITSTAYAKQRYQIECQKRKSGWIRTPSTVVSTSDDIMAVGGHNLGKSLVRIQPSAKIKKGSPQIIEGPQGRILKIHPSDLKSSSTANVIRSFERSGGINAAELNIGRITQTTSREIRTISRGLYRDKIPSLRSTTSTEFKTLGPKRIQDNSLTKNPTYQEIIESSSSPSMIVKADKSSIKIFNLHQEGPLLTQTKSDLVDIIVENLRLNPQASTTLQIHISGLTNKEISGIMQSVKIRLSATPNVKSAGIAITNQSGKLIPLKSVSKTFDFSRAKIDRLFSEQVTEGPFKGFTRITVDVNLPLANGSGSKMMNIRVYINKLKDGLVDKLKSTFKKTKANQGKSESILIDIKRDLKKADESVKDIHIELEDVLITELPLQEKDIYKINEIYLSASMCVSLRLAA